MNTFRTLRTLAVFLLSLIIITLSLGLGFALYYGADGIFSFGSREISVKSDETVDAAGLNSIVIDCESADVSIMQSEDKEIRIVHSSDAGKRKRDKVSIDRNGGRLEVRLKTDLRTWFSFFSGYEKLEIYIPVEYNKNLSADTASGDVSLEDNFKFTEIQLSTASGDITAQRLECETAELNTASGDIELDALTGRHELSTASGSITVYSALGGGRFETASGDVSASYSEILSDVLIKTASGSVDVEFGGPVPAISADTASGDVESNLKVWQSGGRYEIGAPVSDISMEISTASGDIDVRQLVPDSNDETP